MIIVGTAGHIDHGKTTLSRRLTGIETDRLREEQERGISIELGFAYLDLPDGRRVGLIDVPGHEKFVHQMIAGATGIDLVVLTVAADEGIMPQTREHVAICDLLGIRAGTVVLTKIDLVDEEWMELVAGDVRDYLASTFLRGARVLPFRSDWTGDALDAFRGELYGEIVSLSAGLAKEGQDRPLRLPVDRVFPIRGFGTVITGTIRSGEVRVGDAVELVPGGMKARVRRIESHGRVVDVASAGMRTAVNLPEISREQVERGHVVASVRTLRATSAFVVQLKALERLRVPLKRQFKALFHTSATNVAADLRLLTDRELAGGGEALALVRTVHPVPVSASDRFVVRGFSSLVDYGKTFGGGQILWPLSVRGRTRNVEALVQLLDDSLDRQLEAAAWLAGIEGLDADRLRHLTPLTNRRIAAVLARPDAPKGTEFLDCGGRHIFHHEVVGALQERVLSLVGEYHEANPRKEGLSREELFSQMAGVPRSLVQACVDGLHSGRRLTGSDQTVALPDFRPSLGQDFTALVAWVERRFAEAGREPPLLPALPKELNADAAMVGEAVAHLVKAGSLRRINREFFLAASEYEALKAEMTRFLHQNTKATTQDLKTLLGLSRKFLIPLLEFFDAQRITRRLDESSRGLWN